MGDFHELATGPIQERIFFGPPFHRPGFAPIRSPGHGIAHQIQQEIPPELTPQFAGTGLRENVSVLTIDTRVGIGQDAS